MDMRKIKVLKDFPYFHGGYARKDYAKGDEVETEDDEMADVAVKEGWAKEVGGKKPDPLLAEIAELEAKVRGNPNSDQAAELQALLDAKRAELAAK
jgi:hypothetical protein